MKGALIVTNPGSALARLRKTGQRTCHECGKAFVARLAAIYCSAQCRMAATYQRSTISFLWSQSASELGGKAQPNDRMSPATDGAPIPLLARRDRRLESPQGSV